MDQDNPSPNICLQCIGNETLHERLQHNNREARCKYCGAVSPSVTLGELAREIDETLRERLKASEGLAGDPLDYLLQGLIGIDIEPAEDLLDALIEQDPESFGDGDLAFYSEHLYYQVRDIDGSFSDRTWHEFSSHLKHEQRFFGAEAILALRHILGEANSEQAASLPTFILPASNPDPQCVYRARRANSMTQAQSYVGGASKELTAPPLKRAGSGRMNPVGIPAFYGAFSSAVAVAEVRPSVGSLVAVGAFVPSRDLRLLDLTEIGSLQNTRGFFDADCFNETSRINFLRTFHALVTEPVQSEEQELQYLPTQAVSEYVRNVLKFDGIVFASSQIGTLRPDYFDGFPKDEGDTPRNDCNVVIFGSTPKDWNTVFGDCRTIPERLEFPLRYVDDSAQVITVRRVSFEFDKTDSRLSL